MANSVFNLLFIPIGQEFEGKDWQVWGSQKTFEDQIIKSFFLFFRDTPLVACPEKIRMVFADVHRAKNIFVYPTRADYEEEVCRLVVECARTMGFDISEFDKIVGIQQEGVDTFGCAEPNGSRACWASLNPKQSTLAHELGHTFGLDHIPIEGDKLAWIPHEKNSRGGVCIMQQSTDDETDKIGFCADCKKKLAEFPELRCSSGRLKTRIDTKADDLERQLENEAKNGENEMKKEIAEVEASLEAMKEDLVDVNREAGNLEKDLKAGAKTEKKKQSCK